MKRLRLGNLKCIPTSIHHHPELSGGGNEGECTGISTKFV